MVRQAAVNVHDLFLRCVLQRDVMVRGCCCYKETRDGWEYKSNQELEQETTMPQFALSGPHTGVEARLQAIAADLSLIHI